MTDPARGLEQPSRRPAFVDAAGPLVSTFSIIGFDPEALTWGVAIASRFLAVGARTCWGAPNVGVVVIQAHHNTRNGARAFQLLEDRVPADDVIEHVLATDPHRHLRQMAVIDREGTVASYTGDGCGPWAGSLRGSRCAAQGNMLVDGKGVAAMVSHFEASSGPLARRLVGALATGDREGGDSRGRQAAGLLVVRPDAHDPTDPYTFKTIDLRADDHPDPYGELARLLDLYDLILEPTAPDEREAATAEVVRRLQGDLQRLRYHTGPLTGQLDEGTRAALDRLAYVHNLRRRVLAGDWLDRRLLAYVEALATTPSHSGQTLGGRDP